MSEPTEFIPKSEKDIVNAYTQGSFTTIPSEKVVFLRRFFPWQLFRFLMINIRMTIMILKSHK
ncbi:MAG: hypothetical protein F9K24_20925 [Leptonema illini]|jgi:hypothetical protein|uniref:Uncharacterized protein n=2 Tax=Leptonema illini TaxID=183 RepID=H2CGS9_9LEPT|nr:hypothetical protein [Leptonema illini]EHQ04755.1 hypothetical protein Lepil_0044 [Leptonema illini DSM 21528]KAB2929098.1 MAG: hypothetical protein F9K24_20925 [Leptonema illini]PKL30685.1 MAG: hypothetical protein CVV45_16270 [Spirochaetae bacterium HGW-Spirochaetae-10]